MAEAEAEDVGVEGISKLSSAIARYEKNRVLWKKKNSLYILSLNHDQLTTASSSRQGTIDVDGARNLQEKEVNV